MKKELITRLRSSFEQAAHERDGVVSCANAGQPVADHSCRHWQSSRPDRGRRISRQHRVRSAL